MLLEDLPLRQSLFYLDTVKEVPEGGVRDRNHRCKAIVSALGYVAAARKAGEDRLVMIPYPGREEWWGSKGTNPGALIVKNEFMKICWKGRLEYLPHLFNVFPWRMAYTRRSSTRH